MNSKINPAVNKIAMKTFIKKDITLNCFETLTSVISVTSSPPNAKINSGRILQNKLGKPYNMLIAANVQENLAISPSDLILLLGNHDSSSSFMSSHISL